MTVFTLKRPSEVVVELPGGATITARAMTSPGYAACLAGVHKRIQAIKADVELAKGEGLAHGIDLDEPDDAAALAGHLMTVEIGVRHITAWTGVVDGPDDAPAAVTPDNVGKFMEHPIVGKLFYDAMIAHILELDRAKKGSRPGAAGTSGRAPDAATATDAPEPASPAREARKARTGGSAPTSNTRSKAKRNTKPGTS